MPRFEYEVKKGPGEVSKGVMEAENQRAAVGRLRDMGYFPIRMYTHLAKITNAIITLVAISRCKNVISCGAGSLYSG